MASTSSFLLILFHDQEFLDVGLSLKNNFEFSEKNLSANQKVTDDYGNFYIEDYDYKFTVTSKYCLFCKKSAKSQFNSSVAVYCLNSDQFNFPTGY